MSRRWLSRLLFATSFVAFATVPAVASAQQISLSAARRDTVVVGGTGTATIVFNLANRGGPITVRPELELPKGWSPLFDAPSVRLAAHTRDTWLAGVSAPPSAAAGTYVVRATLEDSARVLSDSVIIRIDERRAIEVLTADAPGFIAAGGKYQATFFIRNRGNIPTRVTLSISSGAGSKCVLPASFLDLAAGGKATVVANIAAPNVARSTDDVIELAVDDRGDRISESSVARVLIVPRSASGENDAPSVPAELSLRAAGPHAGVSPIALHGNGSIGANSGTKVDFSLRAPVGEQSIFGERDEYRVDFGSDYYHLGLGDESRMFSPLTASGFPGFGAGLQSMNYEVNAGAYVAQNRWSPLGAREAGAFVGIDTSDMFGLSTAVVARSTGAHVGGVTARAHLFSSVLELETAASDSNSVTGTADRADLTGQVGNGANYGFGVLHAGTSYSGPGRGNDNAHATFTLHPDGALWYQLNSLTQRTSTVPDALFHFQETVSSNDVEVHVADIGWAAYDYFANQHTGNEELLALNQQGPRVGAHLGLGPIDLRGSMAYERVEFGNGLSQPYEMYRLEARSQFGVNQWISAFGESTTGSAFDGLSGGGYVAGGATQLALPLGLSLDLNSSVSLPRYAGSSRNMQGDVSLSRYLPNGSTLMFREHFARYAQGISIPGMNVLYLELRTPIHIPTGSAPSSGRVTGRVTDASGRGMSNMLVRVGDASVLTDSHGRVSLSGLKPGHYGVSLESSDRAATGVLVGDVSVDVPSEKDHAPATFAVSVAQSGRVRASVREMTAAASLGNTADSLVDAGALENAVVALEGVRDTVYQTTNADGQLDFGRVAPGTWIVRVMAAEIPEQHALEVDHFQIDVQPGQTQSVEFHIVPRHRAVHMMDSNGSAGVIRSTPERKLAPNVAQRRQHQNDHQ